MTRYTALFTTVYVFIVMEISTRRIVHCNVTESPALDWVKIQIRDVAAFDRKPRFLLHHNDGIFGLDRGEAVCRRRRFSAAC